VAGGDEHVVKLAYVQFGPAIIVGLYNPEAMAASDSESEQCRVLEKGADTHRGRKRISIQKGVYAETKLQAREKVDLCKLCTQLSTGQL
jgi:hypothetical protein